MKTATFLKTALALGAAAVLATSCNKEEHNNMITDEGTKSVVLKIDLGQTGTKAMTPDDAWSQQEDVVSNIAIYFTDANDIIKYAYKADANANDAAAIIWKNFQKGVRFIGMEGISRVYVVANGGTDNEIVTFANGAYVNDNENKSIRDLNFDIEKFGPTAEQNGVPFVGADIVLESVETVAGGENNAVIIDPKAEGGPYFSAKVSIRPVLSRLEITQVSIQESGTLYFTEDAASGILKQCAEDAPEAMYRFDYSGFDAVLTGVYMSNFYRDSKLIPTPSDLAAWDVFANPGGTSPIVNGDWGSPLQSEYQSIARYTGWTGTDYAALVGSEFEKTEGSTKYLFDGSTKSKVIPFHFLFPYDVTSEEQDADAVANPVIPQLSFQFIPTTENEIVTDNFQYKNQDTWEDITNSSTIAMLKGEVMWPHTTGQSSQEEVYANVVNFATNAEGTTRATIMTGKIYKIQNVLVTPAALATTTQATDGSNIIVEVRIVPFTEENVYPVFE